LVFYQANESFFNMNNIVFLCIKIDRITVNELIENIADYILTNSSNVIAHHNLHSLYLYHHDNKLQEFYKRSSKTHADGMSLIFLGNLLGIPLLREHRITYVDLILPLMEKAAEKGWRVYFVGSKPGVGEEAVKRLRSKYPNLQIASHHGYFDSKPASDENQNLLANITAFRTDILMVGMGMPRQEHWILDNLDSINSYVILPCGACMDYVAGVVRTPPRWAGRIGLEWLFRLISEPSRLWKRYLVEPWFICSLIVKEYCFKISELINRFR
jgi:N-acetylglucosaminyldiphosphoundecaprenol N-acetyl-beta-D-mannosaminyltransferase